jgi:hypothetical protein
MLVGLTALSVLVAVAVTSVAWFVLFPTPRFPDPAGPFCIGTRVFVWTDATRPEPFTTDPNDRRRLVVQIWYPTRAAGPTERYIEHGETMAALARRFRCPAFLLRRVERAPTHAVRNAPAAEGRFPVLLNPTGFSGFRNASLFWIEELTSHGYVVVGLDQPGTAAATVFPDGRVIPVMEDVAEFTRYMPLALSSASSSRTPDMNGVALPGGIVPFLAEDLRFVLNEVEALADEDPVLAGRLDVERVGIFGVSLGGYTGPEACSLDPRFRACVAADAGQTARVARKGLRQPLMIMTRDPDVMRQERAKAGGWPEPEIAHTIDTQRALFERNHGDAYYVTLNGMYHVNWTDAPVWTPIVRWVGLAGPVDPYRGFADVNAYTLAFFDRHLKAQRAPLLEDPTRTRPGVRLEARVSR